LAGISALNPINLQNSNQYFLKSQKKYIVIKDDLFEDITYEELEELYNTILQYGGSSEDFEELINDSAGLFCGNYGDLDFNEIQAQFLFFLKSAKDIPDLEFDDYIDYYEGLENKSPYDDTVDHFACQFEKDYG
jgi:hypothetical protein